MSVSVFDQGPDPAQRDIHLQEKFPAENLRLIVELRFTKDPPRVLTGHKLALGDLVTGVKARDDTTFRIEVHQHVLELLLRSRILQHVDFARHHHERRSFPRHRVKELQGGVIVPSLGCIGRHRHQHQIAVRPRPCSRAELNVLGCVENNEIPVLLISEVKMDVLVTL